MDNVTNFDEYKKIAKENSNKKYEDKPIDYILPLPVLFSGYSLTKAIFDEYDSIYHFGPIRKIGSIGLSFCIGTIAYSNLVRVVTITRGCIVNTINQIKEDMHGDC